jgi:hypothetical protein
MMVAAVVALVLAAMPVAQVGAQEELPINTSYLTALTYQNVGTSDAEVDFNFYATAGGSPVTFETTLAANASASLVVSSVEGVANQGSAVVTSTAPIIATMVQIPQSTNQYNRPLSNGFSAGAESVLIATVLKNQFNQTTVFAVQNTDSANAVDVAIEFIPAPGGPGTAHTINQSIPANASYYVDASAISELGTSFNGSAQVTATGGAVAATVLELGSTAGQPHYAGSFEGVTQGGSPVFMSSALCNIFGGQETFYAVQNNGDTDEEVTVTYTYQQQGSDTTETADATATIGSGEKASFAGCAAMPAGSNGSAVVTGASASPNLVVVGKVAIPGAASLSTIFNGELQGASSLALPYVRWATDDAYNNASRTTGQRTFITIQNVSTTDTIAADQITVDYVDPNGTVIGTHTIDVELAPGAKANSTVPAAGITTLPFGFPGGSTGDGFGGGAVIQCAAANCQLVAVARVAQFDPARTDTIIGEDYNGFQQ